MNLRTKLPLVTSITVAVSILLISVLSIYNFNQRTTENIRIYREEETQKINAVLKDIVNISYQMISDTYENHRSAETVKQLYSESQTDTTNAYFNLTMDEALYLTLENIRGLRFGTDGYVWINEIDPPYRVVMHPIKPELEGKGNVFYVEKETGRENVYTGFADVCNRFGEGFYDYEFYKPGGAEMVTKQSYLKLFEPKGWVIGTGVYIDNIDKSVARKTSELREQVRYLIILTILIGLVITALASGVLYYLGQTITNAIFQIREILYQMSLGKSVKRLVVNRTDEIGDMMKSADALIDGINAYSSFALEIGKGNLDAEFETLSKDDKLGNSLLEMRQSLKEAQVIEEQTKKETEKRTWANTGFAKFSDILRHSEKGIEELAYNVISNLVEYLTANQGGLFLIDDENPDEISLELIASIAYSRRRFESKKIALGIGTIGMVGLEKQTVYMTNIPDNYIDITSGLGTANPRSVLIVPMLIEYKTFGVIELASFNKFEPHEIEFVEKICESIAASLFSVKTNLKTARLLDEFKRQDAEKAMQKAEMKKKMDELQKLKERLQAEDDELKKYSFRD